MTDTQFKQLIEKLDAIIQHLELNDSSSNVSSIDSEVARARRTLDRIEEVLAKKKGSGF